MLEIKIEKEIPLPAERGVIAKYPAREMEIGDSFFVPDPYAKGVVKEMHRLSKALRRKFKTRWEKGGRRVWRVA
jgi:hypothetical protein